MEVFYLLLGAGTQDDRATTACQHGQSRTERMASIFQIREQALRGNEKQKAGTGNIERLGDAF